MKTRPGSQRRQDVPAPFNQEFHNVCALSLAARFVGARPCRVFQWLTLAGILVFTLSYDLNAAISLSINQNSAVHPDTWTGTITVDARDGWSPAEVTLTASPDGMINSDISTFSVPPDTTLSRTVTFTTVHPVTFATAVRLTARAVQWVGTFPVTFERKEFTSSTTVTLQPSPWQLSADAGPRWVSLSWNSANDNPNQVAYDVARDGTILAQSWETTTYVDRSVRPGETHYYSVRAVDDAGNSSQASNPKFIHVPFIATPSHRNGLYSFEFEGTLADSKSVEGPYQEIFGALSPYLANTDQPTRFFTVLGVPKQELVRVAEVPNLKNLRDDTMLTTGLMDPRFADPPTSVPVDHEDSSLSDATTWTSVPWANLAPGQMQETTVSVVEPSLVMAHALWHGSAAPIEMTIMTENDVTAGKPDPVPPDGGVILASTKVHSPGAVTIRIVNTTTIPVDAQFTVGTLPLVE